MCSTVPWVNSIWFSESDWAHLGALGVGTLGRRSCSTHPGLWLPCGAPPKGPRGRSPGWIDSDRAPPPGLLGEAPSDSHNQIEARRGPQPQGCLSGLYLIMGIKWSPAKGLYPILSTRAMPPWALGWGFIWFLEWDKAPPRGPGRHDPRWVEVHAPPPAEGRTPLGR